MRACRLLERQQKSMQTMIEAQPWRIPSGRLAVEGEYAFGIEIGFGKIDADGHVEEMADGGIAESGIFGLGDIAHGRRFGIDQPALGQDPGEDGSDRLADREHDMWLAACHLLAPPFAD